MLFNSLEFAIFLPVVYVCYWYLAGKKLPSQNSFLLAASYLFYGFWDWRFLMLLVAISLLNYLFGIKIGTSTKEGSKRFWLIAGLAINLGTLAGFKYYNFFIDSFVDLISLTGYHLPRSTTSLILPLGISFYIFLSVSYILDIFKNKLEPGRNLIEVLLSLSFFPIILAGPIQRPLLLLPQIRSRREFNYNQVSDGLKQIVWGLFVKIVIADELAPYVDDIFANMSQYSGSTLLVGALYYSIQIYADFSGYSNVAIGTAKLFGFNIMRNFAYPYFARDITEFWRRWHISLTTWFRDYVFLPLSFTFSWKLNSDRVLFIKSDMFIYICASLITWFLTGLWHGANYTFIIWGLIHGLFLIFYYWQKRPRKRLLRKLGIKNDHILLVLTESAITLFIVMVAWVFFRSESINQAGFYLSEMVSSSLFTKPEVHPVLISLITLGFILAEWFQRGSEHALQISKIRNGGLRAGIYYSVVLLILFYSGGNQEFIYSQF
ncbi:MAG: MBOAT family protein [Bacteroidales bacterium]|nr:MBOAT family protein [Bacteroidales bacterium]